MKTKICKKCYNIKSISKFHKAINRKNKSVDICKECRKSPNVKRKEELLQQNKKECSKCHKIIDLSEFGKDKRIICGLSPICKNCRNIRDNEYRLTNKDWYLKYITNYRNTHKQKHQEYMKKYYIQKKRQILLQHYRYIKHKSKYDINFKLKRNVRTRILMAIQYDYKSASTMKLLGCSIDFLKNYLEKQFQPGMNWENHSFKGWHIDHIKPCASFNLSKKSEQLKCFNYKNLQPLWAKDNLEKGNK